ncbi:hypothetical protein Tco_1398834 [Tanacetum coccineum]
MDSFQGLTPKSPSSWHRSLASNLIFYDHVSFHLKCEIDRATGSKLHDKNTDESWEIIENLPLYDHERWNDSKYFVKPVKAISTSQGTLKMLDQRLFELEDQINFLLKGPRPTSRPSSTHIPQAYVEAVSSTLIYETKPQALKTTFEARVRDYMAAHAERIERFENAIFKQLEMINDRMIEMFRLLKELSASRTPEKVLIREEARHPITKNVNSISVIRDEEEKDVVNNRAIIESIVEPSKSEEEEPPKKASVANEVERRADDEPTKTLTNERPAKTDIRLSLASHSYIYPLGIAEDVLVDVAGYVYPVDFMILDIKEIRKEALHLRNTIPDNG